MTRAKKRKTKGKLKREIAEFLKIQNHHFPEKNHYLLTQLADMLLQLYERGVKGLKIINRALADISEGLLECLKKQMLPDEGSIFGVR